MDNNIEIIWPAELQEVSHQSVIASSQPIEAQEQIDSNSTMDTIFVVGSILALGVIAAYAKDRTGRDTAEQKQRNKTDNQQL